MSSIRLFKIRDKLLYCYGENETKAETVYNIGECTWSIENENTEPCLRINHRIQMACLLKGNAQELQKLLQILSPLQNAPKA